MATAFGEQMMMRGLRPRNTSSLNRALDALEAEGFDGDRDGVGDVDELRMGLDPNFGGDGGVSPADFGCVGRVAPASPPRASGFALLVALAASLLVFRSREVWRRWPGRHAARAACTEVSATPPRLTEDSR
jgi:hypothetical protein